MLTATINRWILFNREQRQQLKQIEKASLFEHSKELAKLKGEQTAKTLYPEIRREGQAPHSAMN